MDTLLVDRASSEPERLSGSPVGRGWTSPSLRVPRAKLGTRQEEALSEYLQI